MYAEFFREGSSCILRLLTIYSLEARKPLLVIFINIFLLLFRIRKKYNYIKLFNSQNLA